MFGYHLTRPVLYCTYIHLTMTDAATTVSLLDTCHALVPGVKTSYGYKPSLAAGIIFCALFGLSMIAHTVQLVWKRNWWCVVFSIGCLSM